jgi:DNA-binding HxlR family transcriptional regulator
MDDRHELSAFCPIFQHAIELIGRRWTGAILRAMLAGATRFCDFSEAVPGVSDRLLSERLKELEAEGLVTRTVIPSTPVRVEYHLTDKGRALTDVIDAVTAWANDWLAPAAAPAEPAETAAAAK